MQKMNRLILFYILHFTFYISLKKHIDLHADIKGRFATFELIDHLKHARVPPSPLTPG
jgi:hypothetical protein